MRSIIFAKRCNREASARAHGTTNSRPTGKLSRTWRWSGTATCLGELPPGWADKLPTFSASDKPIATRSASEKALAAVAPGLPFFLGGAADLSPSTKTYVKGLGDFSRGHYGAKNFHFGIREHGMGSVVNGMAVSGLIPYGATFFIFSDYMRHTIRLAALMGVHSIFVFTHDSVFLGEDGPTHEPVEQLASFRAIPNLCTIRPADANETVIAWRAGHRSTKAGPWLLVFDAAESTDF